MVQHAEQAAFAVEQAVATVVVEGLAMYPPFLYIFILTWGSIGEPGIWGDIIIYFNGAVFCMLCKLCMLPMFNGLPLMLGCIFCIGTTITFCPFMFAISAPFTLKNPLLADYYSYLACSTFAARDCRSYCCSSFPCSSFLPLFPIMGDRTKTSHIIIDRLIFRGYDNIMKALSWLPLSWRIELGFRFFSFLAGSSSFQNPIVRQ